MKRLFWIVFFFLFPIVVNASIILVQAEGVITGSSSTKDFFGYGTDDNALVGENITFSITYNTENMSGWLVDGDVGTYGTTQDRGSVENEDYHYPPIFLSVPDIKIDGGSVYPDRVDFNADDYTTDEDVGMNVNTSTNKLSLRGDLDYVIGDIYSYVDYFLDNSWGLDLNFNNIATTDIPEHLPAEDFLEGNGRFYFTEYLDTEVSQNTFLS